MLQEAYRCDECRRLTAGGLVDIVVEEAAGTAQTMGGISRLYSKSVLRICSQCIEGITERSEYAGREDTGAVDQEARVL